MATTRTPRSPRNTRTGSNAMNIQRKINSDYAELARDYGKLFVELWQKPVTKFVLAGAALGAAAAIFRKYPNISSQVTDGLGDIKTKVNQMIHKTDDTLDVLD